MNKDYSKSAVNLTNSTKLSLDLEVLERYQKEKTDIEAHIESLIPQDLKDALSNTNQCIGEITRVIKEDIEISGSYQDIQKGWYAIKQRKVSTSYDAGAFETNYPIYSPAVIVHAVNEDALKGLIKGKLISEADLKAKGVTKEAESFQYYIKAGE